MFFLFFYTELNLLLRRALLVPGEQRQRIVSSWNADTRTQVVNRTSPSASLSACSRSFRPSLLFLFSPFLYLSLLFFIFLSLLDILCLLTKSFYRFQSFIFFLHRYIHLSFFTYRSFLLFQFNENKLNLLSRRFIRLCWR